MANGQRSLMWIRANAAGAAKSLEEQEKAIRRFAEKHGLEIVGSVGGVFRAGDEAAVQNCADEVLIRKRTQNDFLAVVITDQTRFSRLGRLRTAAIEDQLRAKGIELVSIR